MVGRRDTRNTITWLTLTATRMSAGYPTTAVVHAHVWAEETGETMDPAAV